MSSNNISLSLWERAGVRGLPYVGLCLLIVGCGRDPAGRLVAQLESPDAGVRRAAARALGEKPKSDERVIAALTTSLTDSDAEVRRLSINALGAIGPSASSSLPALEKILEDPQSALRLKAALAIGRIDPKNPSYAPVLVAAMRAGDGRILLEVGAMGKDAAWAVPTLIGLLSHDSPKLRALSAQTLGRIGPSAVDAKPALERTLHDPNPTVRAVAQAALDRIQPQSAGMDR